MATWTAPKTWTNEPLIAADMNTYISEDLRALKDPASAHSELDTGNFTTSATSFANIDGTDTEGVLRHTITTNGGDIFVWWHFMIGHTSSVAGSITFNISIDGTEIALDDGIGGAYLNNANTIVPYSGVYLIAAPAAGSHVIRMRWKSSSGSNTCTLYAGGGTAGRDVHPQFGVREIS